MPGSKPGALTAWRRPNCISAHLHWPATTAQTSA